MLGSCISLESQKVQGLEISALGLEIKAFYKPDHVKLPSAPTALEARRGQKWDPGKEACSEMCPIYGAESLHGSLRAQAQFTKLGNGAEALWTSTSSGGPGKEHARHVCRTPRQVRMYIIALCSP